MFDTVQLPLAIHLYRSKAEKMTAHEQILNNVIYYEEQEIMRKLL